jgi:ethanolamine ammonia-lyase small subunit
VVAPGLGPEELKLAKKVAAWLGAEHPPLPWAGSWRPAGSRAYYLSRTPARLGVGRAGTRYRTETVLSFLSDHAAARDAVWSDLDAQVLGQLRFVALRSAAADKREFLARPDLGRRLNADSLALVQKVGEKNPQVQVVVADGLSATACNVNVPLVLPVLEAELRRAGVGVGTYFAISNGRVACADEVARATGADLLCLLVGERPGLKTAESMGAYVTYMKVKGFNEAMRSVISNIHKGGLVPEQGAREIAALCLRGLSQKRTGVDVK